MKNLYALSAEWHINRCLAAKDNPRLFKAYLRYALHDLGIE